MGRAREADWDAEQEYIEQRIRFWVHEAATRGECRCEADREDLAQDLRLDLLRRLPRYDPTQSSLRTFVSLVLEHRVQSLREETWAKKRGRQYPHVSLDEPPDAADADSPDRHEFISVDDYLQATRGAGPKAEEGVDLAIDLAAAEARLSALEVAVCRLLREATKTEVAEVLGVPRTTLQEMVRRIGKKLAGTGLEEYLG